MKSWECIRVYMNMRGEIVERTSRIEVVQAYNQEDAAETFMEIIFNRDPEVTDCCVLIDGAVYECFVKASPVFSAYEREIAPDDTTAK